MPLVRQQKGRLACKSMHQYNVDYSDKVGGLNENQK